MTNHNAWNGLKLAGRFGLLVVGIMIAAAAWTASDPELLVPALGGADSSAPTRSAEPAAEHATYPAIEQHPLFYASRQPWRPEGSTARPSKADLPALSEAYVLIGTVRSGDAKIALLKPMRGGGTISVTEGRVLDGWTLQKIEADGLHFAHAGIASTLAVPSFQPGRDVQHVSH